MRTKSKLIRTQRLISKIVAAGLYFAISFLTATAAEIRVVAYSEDSSSGHAGVIVRLRACDKENSPTITHTTGPDGRCSFSQLTPGPYCLTFARIGYTVIVPSTTTVVPSESVKAVANFSRRFESVRSRSANEEVVRVFRNKEKVDAQKVADFLRSRSGGDALRYAMDLQTMRNENTLTDQAYEIIAKAAPKGSGTYIYQGRVVKIDPQSSSIEVRAHGKSTVINYTSSTKIVDLAGQTREESDLHVDSASVAVEYRIERGQSVAEKITVIPFLAENRRGDGSEPRNN